MMIRRPTRLACAPPSGPRRAIALDVLEDRLLFNAAPIPTGPVVEQQQSGVLSAPPPSVSVADLTTNNTGNNAAVINALLAQNDVVVLPSGVIRVNLSSLVDGPAITIPQGKTLMGQADGSTVLNFVTDGTISRPRGIFLQSNTTLDHLTIQQTGQSLADGQDGVLVYSVGKQSLTITNCTLRGPSTLAQVTQSSRTVVLYLQDCTTLTMQNSVVTGSQAHFGAEMNNVRFATITNSQFYNNGWDGLKFDSNGGLDLHGEISGCSFYNNGQSVAQFSSSNGGGVDCNGRFINFRDCVAYGNYGAGFQVKMTPGFPATDITFTNCVSYGQHSIGTLGQHGFGVVWAGSNPATDPIVERIQYVNCQAHHNDGSGFWFGERTGNITVTNSVSNSNHDAGMRIRSNTVGIVVAGFSAYGNGVTTNPTFNLVVHGGHHHRFYDIYLSGIDATDQNLTNSAQYAGHERCQNLGVYEEDPTALYGGLVDMIIYGLRTEYAKTQDINFGGTITSAGNPSQFQLIQRTFTLSGVESGYAGLPVTFQVNSNYTSPVSTGYQVRVDWNGDGQDDVVTLGAVPTDLTHTFATAGSQQVRLTIVSPRGIVAQTTHLFSAVALPPLPDQAITGPSSGNAGQQLTFVLGAFQGTPPVGQTYRYDVDWNNDGTVDQVFNGAANLSVGYAFLTPGQQQINVKVTDIHQRQITNTIGVQVVANPVAPEFTVSGPSNTEIGQSVQLTFSKTAGASGPYTLELDWNGDHVVDEMLVSGAATVALNHTYQQAGSFTVGVTAINGAGQRTTHTHLLDVVAPLATPDFHLAAPATITAGEVATFTVQLDQPRSDTYSLQFDWNSDGIVDQTSLGGDGFTVTKAFNTPGTQLVTVTLVDSRGNWKVAQHSLQVAVPPPPTLSVAVPTTIVRNQLFTLELAVSRSAEISIDWNGSGAFDETFVANGVVRINHAYVDAGETSILVRATDGYGHIVQHVQTFQVNDLTTVNPTPTPSAPTIDPIASNPPPVPPTNSAPPSVTDQQRLDTASRLLGGTDGNFSGFQQAVAPSSLSEPATSTVQTAPSLGLTSPDLTSATPRTSAIRTGGFSETEATGLARGATSGFVRHDTSGSTSGPGMALPNLPDTALPPITSRLQAAHARGDQATTWWTKITYEIQGGDDATTEWETHYWAEGTSPDAPGSPPTEADVPVSGEIPVSDIPASDIDQLLEELLELQLTDVEA